MPLSKSLSQSLNTLRRVPHTPQWTNARDRLFRPEQLVQAGKTPFEVIYDDGLAKLRYYPPNPAAPT